MLKLIGGAVLCGWALYGLVKYLERPIVRVVINATPLKEAASVAREAAVDDAVPATGDTLEEEAANTESMPAAI